MGNNQSESNQNVKRYCKSKHNYSNKTKYDNVKWSDLNMNRDRLDYSGNYSKNINLTPKTNKKNIKPLDLLNLSYPNKYDNYINDQFKNEYFNQSIDMEYSIKNLIGNDDIYFTRDKEYYNTSNSKNIKEYKIYGVNDCLNESIEYELDKFNYKAIKIQQQEHIYSNNYSYTSNPYNYETKNDIINHNYEFEHYDSFGKEEEFYPYDYELKDHNINHNQNFYNYIESNHHDIYEFKDRCTNHNQAFYNYTDKDSLNYDYMKREYDATHLDEEMNSMHANGYLIIKQKLNT